VLEYKDTKSKRVEPSRNRGVEIFITGMPKSVGVLTLH